MSENETQALSEQITEMTQKWKKVVATIGINQAEEILDDLVHSAFERSVSRDAPDPDEDEEAWEQHYDTASEEASNINNNGSDAQLHWLIQNGLKNDLEANLLANI